MKNESEVVAEYRSIKQKYANLPDRIMFAKDDRQEKAERLKEIINTRLSIEDKTIILLYVETPSYRDLGKKLNLSHTTIGKEVRRILTLIRNEYASLY